jgi:hypothetical protein
MNPARSLTHGGRSSVVSISLQGFPAIFSSASGRFFSFTFLRTRHEWLVAGEAQTRPVQSVSCHATRTER